MFHEISARTANHRVQTSTGTPLAQVAELIDRYPNLSEIELATLINLYSQLSALDAALMISDEQLGRKLDRFYADHRAKLKIPFRQYAVLVAIAVGGLAVIIWALAGVS